MKALTTGQSFARRELCSARTVETRLSEQTPFGCHAHIFNRLTQVYERLIGSVANRLGGAQELVDALDAIDDFKRALVLRDPPIRRTIEDAVCWLTIGDDSIEAEMLGESLSAAARNATNAHRMLLDDKDGRSGSYIWTENRYETPLGQRFSREMLKRLPGVRIEAPSAEQIANVVDGTALVHAISPSMAASAFAHVAMVVVCTKPEGEQFRSCTVPGLPGVIFVSASTLLSRADAAQALLHEAFHLKFLDIDYIHPLFAQGFRPGNSPLVTPVWHRDRPEVGNWPLDRVLTSMHVYLALATFSTMARQGHFFHEWRDGDLAEYAARCRTRSRWLFAAANDHPDLLTECGHAFVAWIGTMLEELEPRTTSHNH